MPLRQSRQHHVAQRRAIDLSHQHEREVGRPCEARPAALDEKERQNVGEERSGKIRRAGARIKPHLRPQPRTQRFELRRPVHGPVVMKQDPIAVFGHGFKDALDERSRRRGEVTIALEGLRDRLELAHQVVGEHTRGELDVLAHLLPLGHADAIDPAVLQRGQHAQDHGQHHQQKNERSIHRCLSLTPRFPRKRRERPGFTFLTNALRGHEARAPRAADDVRRKEPLK